MKLKQENILPILLTIALIISLIGNLAQGQIIQTQNERLDDARTLGRYLINTVYYIVNDAIIAEEDICLMCVQTMSPKTVDRDELLYMQGFISGKTLPYEGRGLVAGAVRLPPYDEADLSVVSRFYSVDRKLANCLLDLSDQQMKQLVPLYEELSKLLCTSSNRIDCLQNLVEARKFDTIEYENIVREINDHLDAIEEILDQTQA